MNPTKTHVTLEKLMENTSVEAIKAFQEILRRAVEGGASDVHLKTGLPPVVRIHDELRVLSRKFVANTIDELTDICEGIIPQRLRPEFEAGKEVDMAYMLAGVGRFRLNIYRYRGNIGIVGRHIPFEIRNLQELGLPPVVQKFATSPRGLVLVTGITGSGKSTTVAACLNEWNQVRSGHIVTIEDPIEYVINDRKSIVSQREVGFDTESFAIGLKAALRQDPDVIMIGELRDKETIQTALSAAETGHLVISTLHTKDAIETVNRIIGVFEPEAQREVRLQFASALSCIVSQRLLPRAGPPGEPPRGFVPAVEVLVNTPFVKSCLLDVAKTDQIRTAMEQGHEVYGMQTFDQHLMSLFTRGLITKEMALDNASSPADFDLQLRGISAGNDGQKWTTRQAPNKVVPVTVDTGSSLKLDEASKNSRENEVLLNIPVQTSGKVHNPTPRNLNPANESFASTASGESRKATVTPSLQNTAKANVTQPRIQSAGIGPRPLRTGNPTLGTIPNSLQAQKNPTASSSQKGDEKPEFQKRDPTRITQTLIDLPGESLELDDDFKKNE